jgi:hypothetical protein
MGTYERLVAEAAEAPIRGFDFSWLEGRATEERLSWHYSEMAAERMTRVSSALDLETGGGEVLARMAGLAPETVGHLHLAVVLTHDSRPAQVRHVCGHNLCKLWCRRGRYRPPLVADRLRLP